MVTKGIKTNGSESVMFLSELKLWNFRKYGANEDKVGLDVPFKKGLNLLVGENDSGKTAIIDAIKYVLGTQSNDYQRIGEKDFYKPLSGNRKTELKIECVFSGLSSNEAAHFLEWLTFDKSNEYELRVRLKAKMVENRVITDIRAGIEGADAQLDGAARELLRVTYLKPLRDAESELVPGYRSRLAQILKSHELFQVDNNEVHPLVYFIKEANKQINNYFTKESIEINHDDRSKTISKTGNEISKNLNSFLNEFLSEGSDTKADFKISEVELSDVLKKLSLVIDENTSGLGTLDLLFIATELLLLQEDFKDSLNLVLIEEIEAHLHPQAQLRLIDYLQGSESKGQFILTTHSTTLASSIKLENLIICRDNEVYPMGPKYTALSESDYSFLERFLDATKANLFFARGVILVEGDAENLLLPTISKVIGKPLHKYGISIVNVGSTAFLRYANIFKRMDNKILNIPVAIITDLDIKPIEYYEDVEKSPEVYCVTDSNIGDLKKIGPKIEFEKIKDVVFESQTSFLKAVRNVNTEKRLPNNFKDNCKDYSKFSITLESIELLRKQRCKKLEKLAQANVQVFVSSTWTLEYDFSLSPLKDHLLKSIFAAKKEMNSGLIVPLAEMDNLLNDEDGIFGDEGILKEGTDEEVAYEIYKDLLNGNVSKAITAQYLAQLLMKDTVTNASILSKDPHIKYLADAIEFVAKRWEA